MSPTSSLSSATSSSSTVPGPPPPRLRPIQDAFGFRSRRVDRPIFDRAACPPERRSRRPTSNLRPCRCCNAKTRSGSAPVASIGRFSIVPPARPSSARGVRHRICVRAGAAKPRRVRAPPRRVDRPISDRAACPSGRRSWRPTSILKSCRSARPTEFVPVLLPA